MSTEIDFEKVENLKPGDVVRTCDMAEIAECDSVPPVETMTVNQARSSTLVPGYSAVEGLGDGCGLRVTTGRLVPVVREG